jgi:hypothetical protein
MRKLVFASVSAIAIGFAFAPGAIAIARSMSIKTPAFVTSVLSVVGAL